MIGAQTVPPDLSTAPILSGNDIGFRVEGNREGRVSGTLMVRVNGKWVETAASLTLRRSGGS
jgi:hypothetical protein